MSDKYEIRALVTMFLGIPVIRYGIVNTSAGLSGRWVENDDGGIWTAPRWILRRWIKLQNKTNGIEAS
jgi:hypothetical protein